MEIIIQSAVVVAIIIGVFQSIIAKKSREIQKEQLEKSRKQFFSQMEQSQKEYNNRIKQFLNEQGKINTEKVNDILQAKTKRFYNSLIEGKLFYDGVLNELYYLKNITNPKCKKLRVKGAYPYIDDNIKDIIGNVSLHQDIAEFFG